MTSYILNIPSPTSLTSPACIKVLAAFAFVKVKVHINSTDSVECPTSNGISLTITTPGSAATQSTTLGQSTAILRYVAQTFPLSSLYGPGTNLSESHVDQWLDFCFNELDVPFNALSLNSTSTDLQAAVKKDVDKALAILDKHLVECTYLVSDRVTVADISIAASLIAYTKGMEGYVNLTRWFNTVTANCCFPDSVGASSSSSSTSSSSSPINNGLQMSGIPPPVLTSLFRRTRTRVKELLSDPSLIGKSLVVKGWARTIRTADKGNILFIELNDGSCSSSLQCVLSKAGGSVGFDEAEHSGGAGASFELTGEVTKSLGKGQGVELIVQTSVLLGAVYGGDLSGTTIGGAFYPLSKKSHTLEHLRTNAHLRARSKIHSAAMRVRSAMAFATHKFFNDQGFLYIHTPIITCADCEGAGEQFGVTTLFGTDAMKVGVKVPVVEEKAAPPAATEEGEGEEGEVKEAGKSAKAQKKAAKKAASIAKKSAAAGEAVVNPREETPLPVGAIDYTKDFFAKRANLTVSGQLNVETHACALSDVYTFGPTFRAENSHTSRHLSEFWMIEPEVCFASLHEDINLAEDYIKYCVKYALDVCKEDLKFFEESDFGEKGLTERLRNVLDNPFKRLNYTEGIDLLKEVVASGHKFEESNIHWGMDLASEHERYLCEVIFKRPVVLMNYPKDIKAFYMKVNEDKITVAACDILVPKIGELVGGSQREHRHDVLEERCKEMKLDTKAIWWYMELRKFGTVPHAGFGLGFERLILFITGIENIRDVIPFPRAPGLAEF